MPKFAPCDIAQRFLQGRGLQIGGSAHNAFGVECINVDLSSPPAPDVVAEQMRQCGEVLPVDVVADAAHLPFECSVWPWVLAAHVIEHTPNPIGTLIEWDRVVRVGGCIMVVCPIRNRTFDATRPTTTWEHLYGDWLDDSKDLHGDPNGHAHVWDMSSFMAFIWQIQKNCSVKWDLEYFEAPDRRVGNGAVAVIRKTGER